MPESVSALMRRAIAQGVCSGAALGVWQAERGWCAGWWGQTLSSIERPRAPEADESVGPSLVPASGAAVGLETLFDLASLTKPMGTTTLLAGALSGGTPRLRLEDRLDLHLPESAPGPLGRARLAELMGHASGAIAWRDYFALTAALAHRPAARVQAVREAVLSEPPRLPPGEEATYSDLGFMALGWMLERVYRAPLDRLFQEKIADPLGLNSARFLRISEAPQQENRDDLCATEIWAPRCPDGRPLLGEVHDDNAAALDGVAGHAGLFASLPDVLRWAVAWLELASGERVPELGIDAALVAQLLGGRGAPNTTWRLGWDTPSVGGAGAGPVGRSSAGTRVSSRAFGHLGFTGTSVWIDPARAAAVVLLTNRVHPYREPHDPIRALRPVVHDALWAWLDGGSSNSSRVRSALRGD